VCKTAINFTKKRDEKKNNTKNCTTQEKNVNKKSMKKRRHEIEIETQKVATKNYWLNKYLKNET